MTARGREPPLTSRQKAIIRRWSRRFIETWNITFYVAPCGAEMVPGSGRFWEHAEPCWDPVDCIREWGGKSWRYSPVENRLPLELIFD